MQNAQRAALRRGGQLEGGGFLKDSSCNHLKQLFPPKQRETTILQGDVQVYNVRIPVENWRVGQNERRQSSAGEGGKAVTTGQRHNQKEPKKRRKEGTPFSDDWTPGVLSCFFLVLRVTTKYNCSFNPPKKKRTWFGHYVS